MHKITFLFLLANVPLHWSNHLCGRASNITDLNCISKHFNGHWLTAVSLLVSRHDNMLTGWWRQRFIRRFRWWRISLASSSVTLTTKNTILRVERRLAFYSYLRNVWQLNRLLLLNVIKWYYGNHFETGFDRFSI